jgi:hypothetical protein
MFTRILQHIFLGLSYVLLSLVIGECHPFSRVTMYNSFSKDALAFYLSDSTGKLLPVKKYFGYSADDIAHNYWTIKETSLDYEKETQANLNEIGKAMWAQIAPRALSTQIPHSIQLHRVSYFLKDDSIIQTDIIIYDVASGKK